MTASSEDDGEEGPLWRALVPPLLVAAAVRAAVALAFAGTEPAGDERAYLLLGERLRLEGSYDGIWAPGYPALIAALGGVFGEATTAALRGLQVLLGTWTVGWVGVVGATLGGRANGVLAAWIAALYLPLAGFSGLLFSEPLHLALFTPALALLAGWAERPEAAGPRRLVVAGVLLGLSTLVRESTLLVLPFLALWTLRHSAPGLPLRVRPALTLVACTIATILPWTLRNASVHGALVPVAISTGGSAHVGLNAYDVNYDLAGLADDPARAPGALRAAIRGPAPDPWAPATEGPPAAQARANVAAGLGFAARHPLYFLRSRAVELVDLLSPLSFPVRSLRLADPGAPLAAPWSRWLFAVLSVLMVPLLLLAALRGATTMAASGAHRGLLLSVSAGVLASALVNGLTRYRLPALPLLFAFAALAIAGTREGDRPSDARLAAIAGTGLVLLWIPSLEPVQQTLSALR